jgi:hypothetical protein
MSLENAIFADDNIETLEKKSYFIRIFFEINKI